MIKYFKYFVYKFLFYMQKTIKCLLNDYEMSLSNICNIVHVKTTKSNNFLLKNNNYLLKSYIFYIKYTNF